MTDDFVWHITPPENEIVERAIAESSTHFVRRGYKVRGYCECGGEWIGGLWNSGDHRKGERPKTRYTCSRCGSVVWMHTSYPHEVITEESAP